MFEDKVTVRHRSEVDRDRVQPDRPVPESIIGSTAKFLPSVSRSRPASGCVDAIIADVRAIASNWQFRFRCGGSFRDC